MSFTPRQPDFILHLKTKSGPEKKGRVGCGWKQEDGSISVQLNVGVVLSWKDDVYLSLFTSDYRPRKGREADAELEQEPPAPAWRG